MTLGEYIKQSQPLPAGSVTVELGEVDGKWKVEGGYIIQLNLFLSNVLHYFTYFVLDNQTILWTMDDLGNIKQQSVFKLDQPF